LFEDPRQALLASLLNETEFADRPLKVARIARRDARVYRACAWGWGTDAGGDMHQVTLTDADFPPDPAQAPQPLMVPGLSLPVPAPLPAFGLFPYGMPVPGVSMLAPGLPGPVPGLALPMLPGGFPLSLPLPSIGLGISPPAMFPGRPKGRALHNRGGRAGAWACGC
jgi:hypothetical protein